MKSQLALGLLAAWPPFVHDQTLFPQADRFVGCGLEARRIACRATRLVVMTRHETMVAMLLCCAIRVLINTEWNGRIGNSWTSICRASRGRPSAALATFRRIRVGASRPGTDRAAGRGLCRHREAVLAFAALFATAMLLLVLGRMVCTPEGKCRDG